MARLLSKRASLAVWFIVCAASRCPFPALSAEPLALPPDISLWDKSLNLRVGLGYKDNLLLSEVNHEESPFISTGVEATLLRLPVDGTQVLAFVSAEDTRYWNGDRVPKEQLFFGQIQVKREFARDWNIGLAVQAIYNDTVFDASITETNLTPVPAIGYGFKAAPFLRKDFGKTYWVELELGINRQYFDEPLDDYWEIGPKITVGRNYGNRSSIAFSYLFNQRSYDDRTPVNSDLSPVPGKTLEYSRHELELAVRHNWDQARRWRMTTSVGWEYNEDNGSGYFNYSHYRLSQQIRYVAKMWELKAQARFNPYYYPNQFATTDSSDKRYKDILTLTFRAERKLTQKIKLFAEYEYEQAYSNEALSEYQANRVIGGIDWEF